MLGVWCIGDSKEEGNLCITLEFREKTRVSAKTKEISPSARKLLHRTRGELTYAAGAATDEASALRN